MQLLWKTVWWLLKKINIELPYGPAIPLQVYTQKHWNRYSGKNLYTNFLVAPFPVARRYKQWKCPSTDKRINKMWCVHTIKYHPTFKKKEVLTYFFIWMYRAAIWMNSEEIMLSEISQSQKNKWYMISLVWGALCSQIPRERK